MTWAELAAVPLENDYVLLRPVRPEDRDALKAIAIDPRIWRYFVYRVDTEADFDVFFDLGLADMEARTRVAYYIADKSTGAAAGSMSFGNLAEKDGGSKSAGPGSGLIRRARASTGGPSSS